MKGGAIFVQVNEILLKARLDSGLSQSKLASRLNVSRSTIANWESGYTSSITLLNAVEAFRALGVPMYPYLMSAIYGEEMTDINAYTDADRLKENLIAFVKELDDFHVKELLYILQGNHGSSPTGTLDLMTAYLHLPLLERYLAAQSIVEAYEMYDAIGEIDKSDNVVPRFETLKKCITAAKQAVLEGKDTYVI